MTETQQTIRQETSTSLEFPTPTQTFTVIPKNFWIKSKKVFKNKASNQAREEKSNKLFQVEKKKIPSKWTFSWHRGKIFWFKCSQKYLSRE